MINKEVVKFLSEIGKIGGASKSQKKLDALKLNRAKWSRIATERKKEKFKDAKG